MGWAVAAVNRLVEHRDRGMLSVAALQVYREMFADVERSKPDVNRSSPEVIRKFMADAPQRTAAYLSRLHDEGIIELDDDFQADGMTWREFCQKHGVSQEPQDDV